jgi:hypothetical protein
VSFEFKKNEITDNTKNVRLRQALDDILTSYTRSRMTGSFFGRPNIPAPSAPSAQSPSPPQ